jgi:hypothetical protein
MWLMANQSAELALPSLSKGSRRTVLNLVAQYQLATKYYGAGNKRFMVLERTALTPVVERPRPVESAVTAASSTGADASDPDSDRSFFAGLVDDDGAVKAATPPPPFRLRPENPPLSHSMSLPSVSRRSDPTPAVRPRVVAEGVPPLDRSNIGHRMLQSMGWTGGALSSSGIAVPLTVEVKRTRSGLGH